MRIIQDLIFIDSGFLVALCNRKDKHHSNAIQVKKHLIAELKVKSIAICYSDYIFDEVITLLKTKHIPHSTIVNFGNNIKNSKLFELIFVSEKIYDQTWKMIKKYQDKGWSFTDASSFVLMKTFDIKYFLSYDEHFTQYEGINLWSP